MTISGTTEGSTAPKLGNSFDVTIFCTPSLRSGTKTQFAIDPPQVWVCRFRVTGGLTKTRRIDAAFPSRFRCDVASALTFVPPLGPTGLAHIAQDINAALDRDYPDILFGPVIMPAKLDLEGVEGLPQEVLQYKTVDEGAEW